MKLVFPVSKADPPVGVLNQSAVRPGATVTVRAGIGLPSHITGVLGEVGAAMGGHTQLGAFTAC